MISSISQLFLFGYYQTQEKAKAAGVPVPEYSLDRPVKSWVDLNPPVPDEDGLVSYLMVATTRMGCGDTALTGADGKPYLRKYKMTPEEARTLNIPPKGDFPDKAQPKGEWNIPCRPLAADEELTFGFGGVPIVQKKGQTPEPVPAAGQSVDLSGLKVALEEISAKLDILLRK